MKKTTTIFLLLILLMTACGQQGSEPVIEQTPTRPLPPTPTDLPEEVEVLLPTAAPSQPVFGKQMGELISESAMFAVPISVQGSSLVLPAGEPVEILGRTVGSHWYQAVSSAGESGWIKASDASLSVPIDYVPIIAPANVQGIFGKVITDSGEPVSDVPFTESSFGETTESDKFGEFAIFLQPGLEGMQTIQVGTPGCGSVVMDSSCTLAYVPAADTMEMLLPDPSPLVLLYSMPEPEAPVEEETEEIRIRATINADLMNLRATPAAQGAVLMQLINSSAVYAIGKTPGGVWTQVIGPNNMIGWLYTSYLDFDEDASQLPVAEVEGGDQISGKVLMSDGTGVEGIELVIYKIGAQQDTETEVVTTASGDFTAFIPPGGDGLWRIDMPVQDCGAAIYDEDCKPTEFYTFNNTAWVSLPGSHPVVFMYQRGRAIIQGSVVSPDGKPYINMNVIAIRDDGAFSFMTTDYSGEFRLPAGPGNWRVFSYLNTIDINSTTEIVNIGLTGSPQPIEIIVE